MCAPRTCCPFAVLLLCLRCGPVAGRYGVRAGHPLPAPTGANDVANSIGPFSSIYQLYHHRGQLSTFMSDDFEEDGVFSGGRRDGTPFLAGSPLVDGASFCGSDAAGVDYFQCRASADVAFPAVVPVHPDAQRETFDLYDDAGALAAANVSCASRCNVANYADYSSVKQDVPLWILAMGGAGIVLGLAMWGYRIIVAIGMKLTKLTPSRGFSIEVGAAVTVILASRVGLPVSTTHCQVGSTIGVGVVELKRGTVNWKQFAGTFFWGEVVCGRLGGKCWGAWFLFVCMEGAGVRASCGGHTGSHTGSSYRLPMLTRFSVFLFVPP